MLSSLSIIPSSVGAAAIIPALAMLWFIVSADRRPEPPAWIAVAFLGGAMTIFVLHALPSAGPLIAGLSGNPWIAAILKAVFVAAIPEELLKVLVILLVAVGTRTFNEPINAVVYGAAVGLGFAAYENVGYLFRYQEEWRTLAVMRNVLTVPLHASLGVIAAVYISRALHRGMLGGARSSLSQLHYATYAVVIPIVLHALFDAPLLALRVSGIAETWEKTLLQVAGLLIGATIISLASRLAMRVAGKQRLSPRNIRVEPNRIGLFWASSIFSATTGFAGTVLLVSCLTHVIARRFESLFVQSAVGAGLLAGSVLLGTLGFRLFRHDDRAG